MEQRIINVILRWMWLFVLATIGGGVAAYWYGVQQPTDYEASVRLIVGPGVDGLSPDLNDLRAGAQLMQTYRELATTRPILQAVIDDVGLDESAERLSRRITVRDNAEAQVLTVYVRDEDPVRSAAIANSIANVLLRLSPSGGESPAAILMSQIRTEAATLQENIATIEERIRQLEAALQSATTAEEQQLYIDQLSQERARLAESRATLAGLLEALLNTPTNQVKIVEPAIIGIALSQSLSLIVLVGSAAGMLLAGVTVLAYEYLDKSIKSADELEERADVSVMSTVVLEDEEVYGTPDSLTVRARPQSSTAEEYRRLATKLPLAGHSDPVRVIVVCGLDENAGAQSANEIAANLAVILAQMSLQVLLMDANLAYPTAHSQFGLSSTRTGLTDYLRGRASNAQPSVVPDVPGLRVLTSQQRPDDAFSDLASPRVRELLSDLRGRVDAIVITAPPLSVAASLFLTSHADGVLLVAQHGSSTYPGVVEAKSNLSAIDVRLLGVVLAHRKQNFAQALKKLGRQMIENIRAMREPAASQPPDAAGEHAHIARSLNAAALGARLSSTVQGVRRGFGRAGRFVNDRVRSNAHSFNVASENNTVSEKALEVEVDGEVAEDPSEFAVATDTENVELMEESVVES